MASRDPIRRETDLYGPLRDYLVSNGYDVRSEVQHCDITARKGDDLIVVELKRQISIDLLVQATERHRITDSVYVAVPRPASGKRMRGVKRLLRRLELGLIFVSFGARKPRVEVVFHPAPYRRRKLNRARRAVIEEMDRRSGDYNQGGSAGRKLVTAYRENAIHIACCLERLGTGKPRELRALGTGEKTLSILSRNVYGWFERVGFGVYTLTDRGRRELEHFPAVASEYRARVATAASAGAPAATTPCKPQ